MKNFIASLQQDANNLVKEATELSNIHKEIWGLSGREALLADKEAMASLNQTEADVEDIEAELEEEMINDYDGSREAALDDHERTEMAAIRNNQ